MEIIKPKIHRDELTFLGCAIETSIFFLIGIVILLFTHFTVSGHILFGYSLGLFCVVMGMHKIWEYKSSKK